MIIKRNYRRPRSGLHRLNPEKFPHVAQLFRHSFITFISSNLITLTFSYLRMCWWWWDAYKLPAQNF